MRLFFSYIMSHMYDIHAIVAGAMVVAVMMYIKAPIKKRIKDFVKLAIEKKPELAEKRELMIKRGNSILIVLVFPLAVVAFSALVIISPFIFFSWQSSIMAGVFALCIYAFIEQVSKPGEKKD